MKFIDIIILVAVISMMGLIAWKKFFSKKKQSHCKNCPYGDCSKKNEIEQ
ncbi:MAG: FeoB-associated Cys-rich membrane protein [Clostridiales bacterium]|nr:FeoB-associated Cys-rich membrane protein [Clostridiales bacterium]